MDYDAELRLHNEVLRRACDIHRDERVLDWLRETLAAHHDGRGVWFDSRARTITAG